MTSSTSRVAGSALATLLALATIMLAAPASAAPSGASVAKVYRLPCSDSACGAGDAAVADGGTASGSIQIHVKSESTIGLSSVTLQGRAVVNGDAGSWICLRKWSDQGSSFSGRVDWSTDEWPGSSSNPPAGCGDASVYGSDTRNAVYDFRVQAVDATGSTTSSTYSVKVSNAAARPVWDSEPDVSGADDKEPIVTLRWQRNTEPDIREYHFIRRSPGGAEQEFAVSASKPGGQGCESDSETITCFDDTIPTEGFAGEYTYSLVAFRSSPSSSYSCSISPYGDCAPSPVSAAKSLSIEEPAERGPDAVDTPPPTKTGGGSTGGTTSRAPTRVTRRPGSSSSSGSYADFFTGEFDKRLPYDQNEGFDLPAGDEEGDQVALGPENVGAVVVADAEGRLRALRILSGGLIMLLVAAHLARLLRDPADHLR